VNGLPLVASITIIPAYITLPSELTEGVLVANTNYSSLTWSIPQGSAQVLTTASSLVITCDCLSPVTQIWQIPIYDTNGPQILVSDLVTAPVTGNYTMSFQLTGAIETMATVMPLQPITIMMANRIDITPDLSTAIVGMDIPLTVSLTTPMTSSDIWVTVTLVNNDGAFDFMPSSITFTPTNTLPQIIMATPIVAGNDIYDITGYTTVFNTTTGKPQSTDLWATFPVDGVVIYVRNESSPITIELNTGVPGYNYGDPAYFIYNLFMTPPHDTITLMPALITSPQQNYTMDPDVSTPPTWTTGCWNSYGGTGVCDQAVTFYLLTYFGPATLTATITGVDANLYHVVPFTFPYVKGE
jgi:hypothetical protein